MPNILYVALLFSSFFIAEVMATNGVNDITRGRAERRQLGPSE
jgi:hypothetical protein